MKYVPLFFSKSLNNALGIPLNSFFLFFSFFFFFSSFSWWSIQRYNSKKPVSTADSMGEVCALRSSLLVYSLFPFSLFTTYYIRKFYRLSVLCIYISYYIYIYIYILSQTWYFLFSCMFISINLLSLISILLRLSFKFDYFSFKLTSISSVVWRRWC